METNETIVIYQGAGKVMERNELLDPAGMFLTVGVRKGDVLELVPDGLAMRLVTVGGVLSAQSIALDGDLPEARPFNASFIVRRSVEGPCPVCKEERSDHKHCWSCQEKLHKEHPKANCEVCLDKIRDELAQLGADDLGMVLPYSETIEVPGTRKTMVVRTRTVEEADRITEEQEVQLLLSDSPPSPDLVAHDMRLMLMSYAVVSDVNGTKVVDTLPPRRDEQNNEVPAYHPVTGEEVGVEKEDTLQNRMRFFAGMRRVRYDAMERVVQHFDTRVAEACAVEIKDELTEDELLMVADHLATQDEPYVGVIKALDGKLPIAFSESTTDDAREVKELLDKWRKAQGRDISEFRFDQMAAVVKLASFFRADNRVDFGDDSELIERLPYILSLPTDLYYHYTAAASVFDERLRKAEGLLKNS